MDQVKIARLKLSERPEIHFSLGSRFCRLPVISDHIPLDGCIYIRHTSMYENDAKHR